MLTQIRQLDEDSLKQAAELIRSGQVVAFPTETVYGLGADALDVQAVARIFEAKGRPQDNPLIVHISHIDQLADLVADITPAAQKAMSLWPGPLTLVMKKSDRVPDGVTAGLNSVGIRLPHSKAARDLIDACGCPIAAPSANLSGRPSPTSAADVMEDMYGRIPLVLDGGACAVGVESTVLDVTGDIPVILRPGGVTQEQLAELLGEVRVHPSALAPLKSDAQAASPGMKYRHYAPQMPMYIARADQLEDACARLHARGFRTVALVQSPNLQLSGATTLPFGGGNPQAAAASLYAALRECDRAAADVVLAEGMQDTAGISLAVMNRMLRAAGFKHLYEKNILMVCTGNTCRSPMAAGLLAHMLAEPRGMSYTVTSGGIAAFAGDEASHYAKRALHTRGIDLCKHRSRRVQPPMMEQADLILCMTTAHRNTLRGAFPDMQGKIFTLGEYAGEGLDVPDPFGGDMQVYERTAVILEELCGLTARRLFEQGI